NGGEFLNEDVIERFARRKDRGNQIAVYRSRPYKKNDQCFVEQKNYTHVRELYGYDRIDWKIAVRLMNNINQKEWYWLCNYFRPRIRLVKKWREGSKIKRVLSSPQTPLDRLLESPSIDQQTKDELRARKAQLNPRSLKKGLKQKLIKLRGY